MAVSLKYSLTIYFPSTLLKYRNPYTLLFQHIGVSFFCCAIHQTRNDILVEGYFRPVGILQAGFFYKGSFLRNSAEHGDLPLYTGREKLFALFRDRKVLRDQRQTEQICRPRHNNCEAAKRCEIQVVADGK